MPKKLMECVKRVMAEGKSESEAFAICIVATGQKPHKQEKKEKK